MYHTYIIILLVRYNEDLILFGITDHSNDDRLWWYGPANVDGKNCGFMFQRVCHILFRTSSCEYIFFLMIYTYIYFKFCLSFMDFLLQLIKNRFFLNKKIFIFDLFSWLISRRFLLYNNVINKIFIVFELQTIENKDFFWKLRKLQRNK